MSYRSHFFDIDIQYSIFSLSFAIALTQLQMRERERYAEVLYEISMHTQNIVMGNTSYYT